MLGRKGGFLLPLNQRARGASARLSNFVCLDCLTFSRIFSLNCRDLFDLATMRATILRLRLSRCLHRRFLRQMHIHRIVRHSLNTLLN